MLLFALYSCLCSPHEFSRRSFSHIPVSDESWLENVKREALTPLVATALDIHNNTREHGYSLVSNHGCILTSVSDRGIRIRICICIYHLPFTLPLLCRLLLNYVSQSLQQLRCL